MNVGWLIDRLMKIFIGDKCQSNFPRVVQIREFAPAGCLFEVSNEMESFRIEDFGDEEYFTSLILDELVPGDVFFDIGACVGLISVHAAKKHVVVYSFEPDPYYRSRLVNNLLLNELGNVRVIEWAVSDKQGETVLFTDGEGGNSPSLANLGDRNVVNVITDTIDNAISKGDISLPNVVKIDIEGAEMLALSGMRGLLTSTDSPRAVFLEIHPDYLGYFGSFPEEVEHFMLNSGYALERKIERGSQIHSVFRK